MKRIIISGISTKITDDELKKKFIQYGDINSITTYFSNTENNTSKIGIIEFKALKSKNIEILNLYNEDKLGHIFTRQGIENVKVVSPWRRSEIQKNIKEAQNISLRELATYRLSPKSRILTIDVIDDWTNREFYTFLNTIGKAYNYIYSLRSIVKRVTDFRKYDSRMITLKIVNDTWPIHDKEILRINSVEIHSPGIISFEGADEVITTMANFKILREQEIERLKQEQIKTEILRQKSEQEATKTEILKKIGKNIVANINDQMDKNRGFISETASIQYIIENGILKTSDEKKIIEYENDLNEAVSRFKDKFGRSKK